MNLEKECLICTNKDYNGVLEEINRENITIVEIEKNDFNIKGKKIKVKELEKLLFSGIIRNIFFVIELKNDANYKCQKQKMLNLICAYSYCSKYGVKVGIKIDKKEVIGMLVTERTEIDCQNILDIIKALTINDKRQRYEYIYDTVCNQLDKEFQDNNFCDFKCDRCKASRANYTRNKVMGCCYSFNYNVWRGAYNIRLCKYLKDNKCTIKCIACKMFTCKYLQKKGIKYNVNNILLLDCFFSRKQKEIISSNFFIDKNEIIDKLLEENYMPYIFYYILDYSRINKNKVKKYSLLKKMLQFMKK